ncbi:KamA family radical SAM protein [Polyangium jinanense]|uniref:KamA family radical SAM protein n=1 Tax=Polyangium jinanense TaxID=2829994 RepID=A0A9X4AVD1_9BACT|nr:KamA family radical SAM protein [Polyangium jinanense]MDC3959677.1 KamA family radical SAM protein [Polyangium jinanense]MDC3984155.1 KamA family radical SAM protein [Polyangium jinanense]
MTAQSLVELSKRTYEIVPLKPPVDPARLEYKNFKEAPDWRRIPAYADVTEEQFLDHRWQSKKSITRPDKLLEALRDLVSEDFIKDATEGFARAPMSVRVSPYLLSLIDWNDPYRDPLRTQFIPLKSRFLPDHPKLGLDSLHERADAPVPGLTHRYADKALFLPLDTCPVYCRFCTRSYAVGIDTEEVEKTHFKVDEDRWRAAYTYISSRPELEDIVVSGGDAYNLRPEQIRSIGETLLGMSNIRRIRLATKGPAVMPQKILTDNEWIDAVTYIADLGRKLHKEVAVHTHFNNPNEITGITRDAMQKLFERGIRVRNQSVLIRGVNDDPETMKLLVKRLGHLNVQPYYVYVHDLVKGAEDLRTTVATGELIEKHVRGSTAGFNTPTVVVDAPGGGGKRDVHSYEFYDRTTGISIFEAPSVKPGQKYLYFDPIDRLPDEGRARWADPREHQAMIDEAMRAIS